MAFCLDLAPDHLRKILGSSIHISPCLFSYDNKFCTVESSIAFCIMQLAGTVSIRAHLDADVKSSELVGAALQLIHRCWSKGLALQLREIDGCGCLEWQQWGLQTLRAMGSVSVAWHNVLAGHIGQAYIIALPVTLHASCRIATTALGSYKVFFLRLSSLSCLPVFRLHAPLLAYQRSPSHPACSCHPSWFFGLAFLNAPLGPSQPRMAPVRHECKSTSSPPKRPAPFTNRVLVRPVLSLAKSPPSALIGYNSDAQLLQFVYDLWLFTTIGGAKNSANAGIREALAAKPYSPELWHTYHAALIDLQKQLGWPSLFITVAPYEWSFPSTSG